MASIEFLTKRIEGKEKEIATLEKKIGRILKAKESNWENNPYYYNERDLTSAQRDLDDAKAGLEKYKELKAEEESKANSRNVKEILDFLENWKTTTRAFYLASLQDFLDARSEFYAEDKALCDKLNHSRDRQERDVLRNEMRRLERAFQNDWGWIKPYITRNGLDLERLDKDLKAEAERKYDFIIERTIAITGEITDASNLYIAKDGMELNGFIIGKEGTAKVQTVGAGGWNIQRFHFRTLVRAI